jgi:hypothetical protein
MNTSRKDYVKGESISMLTQEALNTLIADKFGSIVVNAVSCERGEVLLDPRGNGSLQQLPKSESSTDL